jgi:thymidylate kinase
VGETVRIISFSGIDGAGKSTQILALQSWLRDAGLCTKLLTFWDDVVVASRFREAMSHAAFKGDQGVGSPEKPIERRDKNVTSWLLNFMRICFYSADAINARLKVVALGHSGVDILIFDRYIYDELANLPLDSWVVRLFVRLTQKLVRGPDIAYLIDADPSAARMRKPEYPLDFLCKNREAYLRLAKLTGDFTVIEPLTIDEAQNKIKKLFLEKLKVPEAEICGLPAIQ